MSTPSAVPLPLHPPTPTPLRELYRQVWRHARDARGRLVLALALLASSQLLKLALPWMAAQAINAVQTSGRAGLQLAALWILAIVGLNATAWTLFGPARVLERGVALRVRRSVADELYLHLAQAPLAWHEGHHSGDLQHRVDRASHALYSFTQSQFIYLQNVVHLAGPLLALWWLSRPTGALALAGFIGIALLVLRFDRALMRLAEDENQAERRYSARLLDFLGNISAVASLRLQRATRALLDARLLAVFVPLRRSIVITEWKWCAVDLLTLALGWALVVLYASTLPGVLLIGSLFMVQQYAQQAASVLCSMAANFQGLAHTQVDHAGAETIRRAPRQVLPAPLAAALASAPSAASGSATATGAPVGPEDALPADWRSIDIENLSYRHAREPGRADSAAHVADTAADTPRGGVHAATFTLRRGERVALVGPSGSGKSTLLRMLAGLYAAQHGAVVVDGLPQAGRRDAAELATLIPQEAEIFEASVRDNLTLGQTVSAADVQRALQASALDEVLAGLPQGLDTPLSERGFNLSGGQRQRLALARGVLAARGSSLLLLDEPTSALDPLIEQHVHTAIARAFHGACIVASVHRLSLLPHFDRVVLMVAGRVVDVGTTAELQARQPLFAALRNGNSESDLVQRTAMGTGASAGEARDEPAQGQRCGD